MRSGRSIWGRIAGYGGAVLLVAAAVAVLLVPLLENDGGADPAGARAPANGVATPSNAPTRHTAPPATIRTPGATAPGTGGTQGGGRGGTSGGTTGDGGPPMPGDLGGGTGTSWCPQGTAFYKATGTGVDVAVAVASSGAVRAELQVQGGAPQSQQTTIRGGSPHTFRFIGVSAQRVERVKITTVSVGVAMQTCYARAAA
ncbi:hypothetical protein GCM10010182_66240 [Actinomadura cremea]|nr:hypothetical protein GCM10010182_66240 [Actinomadura cremea]